MGEGSKWASVIYTLKESKWERFKMGCCCLPPDRVKITVISKKETSSRVKMSQGSKWASVIYPLKDSKWAAVVYPLKSAKGQNGLLLLPPERVKIGCCCLPPDRVKLRMKSKKETNVNKNLKFMNGIHEVLFKNFLHFLCFLKNC